MANQIDQVITDASELFGVPKDHRHMEEARHMVLKAGMNKFCGKNGGNHGKTLDWMYRDGIFRRERTLSE